MAVDNNLVFELNIKDLAVAEVLQQVAQKGIILSLEEIERELKTIDISVASIQEPLGLLTKKLNEVGENITADFTGWANAIDQKKDEIRQADDDFSSYDEAFAEAEKVVQEDITALTREEGAKADASYRE